MKAFLCLAPVVLALPCLQALPPSDPTVGTLDPSDVKIMPPLEYRTPKLPFPAAPRSAPGMFPPSPARGAVEALLAATDLGELHRAAYVSLPRVDGSPHSQLPPLLVRDADWVHRFTAVLRAAHAAPQALALANFGGEYIEVRAADDSILFSFQVTPSSIRVRQGDRLTDYRVDPASRMKLMALLGDAPLPRGGAKELALPLAAVQR